MIKNAATTKAASNTSPGLLLLFYITIGTLPLLPYPVDFDAYTAPHVIESLQLLLFASFAFFLLITSGIYPPEGRTISLDTDWPLRLAGGKFIWFVKGPLTSFSNWMDGNVKRIAADFSLLGEEKEERVFIGVSVMLALLFLAFYLIVELLYQWIFS